MYFDITKFDLHFIDCQFVRCHLDTLVIRCLTKHGDVLIGEYSSVDEIDATIWAFKNIPDYEGLLTEPSFYVLARNNKTKRTRLMVRGRDYQRTF